MRRLISLNLIGALIAVPSAGHAQSNSASTVRGQLSVQCAPTQKKYAGKYEYRLAGKLIRALSSDCSPKMGTSHINIQQVFRSPIGTTLLVVEGVSATSQIIRVLHIPSRGPASTIETLGGDGYALIQKSSTVFQLVAPGGGFAISGDRMSTWTCVIDVNFRSGRAEGDLAVPYEPGLPQSVCRTKIARVPI